MGTPEQRRDHPDAVRSRERPVHREAEGLDFGRILAFSDNVVAFALTLVVANVVVSVAARSADQEAQVLIREGGVFLVTFLLVGVLWLRHFQFCRELRAFDHYLLVVNLGFLAAVALSPVAVRVAIDFRTAWTYAFYALTLAAATALLASMELHARDHGLAEEGSWVASRRLGRLPLMVPSLVLICSIPLGALSPEAGSIAVLAAAIASGLWHVGVSRGSRPRR